MIVHAHDCAQHFPTPWLLGTIHAHTHRPPHGRVQPWQSEFTRVWRLHVSFSILMHLDLVVQKEVGLPLQLIQKRKSLHPLHLCTPHRVKASNTMRASLPAVFASPKDALLAFNDRDIYFCYCVKARQPRLMSVQCPHLHAMPIAAVRARALASLRIDRRPNGDLLRRLPAAFRVDSFSSEMRCEGRKVRREVC